MLKYVTIQILDKRLPVVWSSLYMLFLNMGIHLLRPGRDMAGLENGILNLPFLFSLTFLVILLLNFGVQKIKKSFSHKTFSVFQHLMIPGSLLVYIILNTLFPDMAFMKIVFFVWVSIVNLWCISFAWDIITNGFSQTSFIKEFGFIASCGTLGCISGYGFSIVAPGIVLYLSLASFIIALIISVKITDGDAHTKADVSSSTSPVTKEPQDFTYHYGVMIFLYALITTFIYFQQAKMVITSSTDEVAQHSIFAHLGFWVSILALFFQLFFTSRIIQRAGLFYPVVIIPAVLIGGLVCFTFAPSLLLITLIMAFGKVASFSLIRPVRESLLMDQQNSAVRNHRMFFNTVVYRGGDVAGSWMFIILYQSGLSFRQLAFITIPLCMLWLITILLMKRNILI